MSYDNFAHTFSKSRKNHPWPEIDYIIEDLRTRGYGSILDIGCGNGRFIEEMKKTDSEAPSYLGIDSSQAMIKEACSLHPEYHFKVCDMSEISSFDFGDELFDVVIFLASFHHLKSQEERLDVLYNTKRLLSPCGRIYMTNWNLLNQSRYEKSHKGNGDFDIKIGAFSRYYHGFTCEELAELFGKTGYQIIKNGVFGEGKNIISILE